ncbi:hypothetical protein ALQ51_02062 [Pseudomonas cannabina]|uniref:Uncharacterized protein n=1 Tax=Pseudomonas cannabina TaxID=86840 RepID=A0A3M3R325_PSECA|nr:hypothetical protein ALQ51_02062 [Pseudomonas cannabina]
MINLLGYLAIRTISGRNGAFNVGRLSTSIGEFFIKDALLDGVWGAMEQGSQLSETSRWSVHRWGVGSAAMLEFSSTAARTRVLFAK